MATNRKFGSNRNNTRRKVVRMRDKAQKSWGEIATELEVSPRTVRALYDEAKGTGAHFDSRIEGKGGRTRQMAVAS